MDKLSYKIKDKKALKLIYLLISSEKTGLSIGAMTSQILAIFYLDDLDKFIKEELKCDAYIRYQDDFVLFHKNKKVLIYWKNIISEFLLTQKLNLNPSSKIYSSKVNMNNKVSSLYSCISSINNLKIRIKNT